MAVVGLAKERKEREGTDDGRGKRTYRRTFLVETDDKDDDVNIVLTAPGLPQQFFPYTTPTSVDLGARCVSLNPRQIEGTHNLWEVEALYDTEYGNKDPEDQDEDNPLLDTPEIEVDFEEKTEQVGGAIDQSLPDLQPGGTGQHLRFPFTSTIGEPFDPVPEVEVSTPMLRITRNEATVSPKLLVEFQDAVNSDNYLGLLPRQAKLAITARNAERNGVNFWVVTYTLKLKRENWDLKELNRGTYYKDAQGKLQAFRTDGTGDKYVGILNEFGNRVPNVRTVGQPGVDAHFVRFRYYYERPFAVLNLPINFVGDIFV